MPFATPLHLNRPLCALALVTWLLWVSPRPLVAHEIPTDVTVQALAKPEGDRLRLLVRVPLTSLRDVDFPLRGAGYLDISRLGSSLEDAARLWIADYVRFFEDNDPIGSGEIIATRLSLPSDRSFASFGQALSHVTSPLPRERNLVPEQWLLDVLLEYPIRSADSRFSIWPEWAHLGVRTTTVLRFVPPGAGERLFHFAGNPGLVRLDPRWHQATHRFVRMGVVHILSGIDHLLFLLCLLLPIRRFGRLVAVVTAFTAAHSITLIASALGLAPAGLWFPPLVETLIALSIVYLAIENIAGKNLGHRWQIAFAFGLVHGFGFSFALRESLQFAGSHLIASLLAFNIGVELGQLLVLLLLVPVLGLLFRHVLRERVGTIVLSALIAHTAWHWMTERGSELLQYRLQPANLDLALLASSMRWLILLLVAAGAVWLLGRLFGRFAAESDRGGDLRHPAAKQ